MKSKIISSITDSVWESIEHISDFINLVTLPVIRIRCIRTSIVESISVPIRNSIRLSINNSIYIEICDIVKEMNKND